MHKKFVIICTSTAIAFGSLDLLANSKDPLKCRPNPYTGVSRKDGYTWDVPAAGKTNKIIYECKAVGGDTEAARLTLFKDGSGEIGYVAVGDENSAICPLKWKLEEKGIFSIDLKSQPHLKLFFTQSSDNQKYISDGRIQFGPDTKISVSTTRCDSSIVNP